MNIENVSFEKVDTQSPPYSIAWEFLKIKDFYV